MSLLWPSVLVNEARYDVSSSILHRILFCMVCLMCVDVLHRGIFDRCVLFIFYYGEKIRSVNVIAVAVDFSE